MIIRTLTIICFFLVPSATWASSLTLDETVRKLDPSIQSVSLCGRWKHHNEEGVYRVIYGWLWGHTEIYVQWVADPIWYPDENQEERQVPLVIKTATFPEYNHYEAATDLENVKCLLRDDKWIITADADNGHESDPDRAKYQLIIYLYDEPGTFRLEEKAISNSSKGP